jgi:hypothetical protein
MIDAGKVQVAFHVLDRITSIEWGPGWQEDGGRDLTASERRLHDIAIATLAEFLNHEIPNTPTNFPPPPPPQNPPPPQEAQPVRRQ